MQNNQSLIDRIAQLGYNHLIWINFPEKKIVVSLCVKNNYNALIEPSDFISDINFLFFLDNGNISDPSHRHHILEPILSSIFGNMYSTESIVDWRNGFLTLLFTNKIKNLYIFKRLNGSGDMKYYIYIHRYKVIYSQIEDIDILNNNQNNITYLKYYIPSKEDPCKYKYRICKIKDLSMYHHLKQIPYLKKIE